VIDLWIRWITISAFAAGLPLLVYGCEPSAKAKAILADEEIRREVCASLLPDGQQYFTYSHVDTQHTQDEIKQINRWVDAYCN
jgi:hypothetical protein